MARVPFEKKKPASESFVHLQERRLLPNRESCPCKEAMRAFSDGLPVLPAFRNQMSFYATGTSCDRGRSFNGSQLSLLGRSLCLGPSHSVKRCITLKSSFPARPLCFKQISNASGGKMLWGLLFCLHRLRRASLMFCDARSLQVVVRDGADCLLCRSWREFDILQIDRLYAQKTQKSLELLLFNGHKKSWRWHFGVRIQNSSLEEGWCWKECPTSLGNRDGKTNQTLSGSLWLTSCSVVVFATSGQSACKHWKWTLGFHLWRHQTLHRQIQLFCQIENH